jgi:hypothetical protein
MILSRTNPNNISGVQFKSLPLRVMNSRIPTSDMEYMIPKCLDPYASNFPRNFFSAGVNAESGSEDGA